MHVPTASPPEPRTAPLHCPSLYCGSAPARRRQIGVETIGHLVAQTGVYGRVHSVFAQACNVACGDLLLTLAKSGADRGPATLLLAVADDEDLRRLFRVGEDVEMHSDKLRTRHVDLQLSAACVWRPSAPPSFLPAGRIAARLRYAHARLAERRRTHSSVIDREGAPIVAALAAACRSLERAHAVRQFDLLIGWGEGLTPAGDDCIVGLLAAIAALVGVDEARRGFLAALAGAVIARAARTTPIAAHLLRLAAAGHYGESLLRVRDALLGEPQRERVAFALDRAFDLGATSGADAVTGLLCGLAAWLPAATEHA